MLVAQTPAARSQNCNDPQLPLPLQLTGTQAPSELRHARGLALAVVSVRDAGPTADQLTAAGQVVGLVTQLPMVVGTVSQMPLVTWQN